MGGLFDFFKFSDVSDDNSRGETHRQDHYHGESGSSSHEHTWSKTTSEGGGQHKEGWHGDKAGK